MKNNIMLQNIGENKIRFSWPLVLILYYNLYTSNQPETKNVKVDESELFGISEHTNEYQ
jgi:hypothetical protein